MSAYDEVVPKEKFSSDPAALSLINATAAERLGVLPAWLTPEGLLGVYAETPDDLSCSDELRILTGRPVELLPSPFPDLRAEIRRAYRFRGRISTLSKQYLSEERNHLPHAEPLDNSSPAAEIVQTLFIEALHERASDIHIEPGTHLRVRYRIDGRLVRALELPPEMHSALTARIKVMSRMDIAKKRVPQDGRMTVSFEGRAVDVRVSTLPTVHGEKTVMRLLDPKEAEIGLEGLGCSPSELASIRKLLRTPHGLILNTGPTGSGKSTTLYAMLKQLDLLQFNAVAVEDPVEYEFPNVSQVMVDEKSGLTFASALRSILRQDPDIILVGEIRDAETAMLAVQAALTGHLVLATVHANDAPSAPARLINMGIPPYLLASALRGVMAQRLVRRLCPACRMPVAHDGELFARLGFSDSSSIYRAVGCPQCSGRGYKGRCGVFQIMYVDAELSAMIARAATSPELDAVARRKGMKSLLQAAADKVAQGVTSLEEALAAVGDETEDLSGGL